jgi:predicted protein tyrosine phosphatase
MNLLFICSRNKWRSPTAEKIWSNINGYSTRSAGTSPNAIRTIKIKDVQWADVIFVMEKKHKNRVRAAFPRATQFKNIHILDIPDEYQFNDPELISELTARVDPILNFLKEQKSP